MAEIAANQWIERYIEESARVKRSLLADVDTILKLSKLLADVIRAGGCIYSCGNGGSACDAIHLTEELVARYLRERPGIRAMHFGDPGILTCWGNDYDFKSVYKRCVETHLTSKDALIVFTTSGNSDNILQALAAANAKGALTIGLLGKGGGKARALCNRSVVVQSDVTSQIQEAHIVLVHLLCDLLEQELFPGQS